MKCLQNVAETVVADELAVVVGEAVVVARVETALAAVDGDWENLILEKR